MRSGAQTPAGSQRDAVSWKDRDTGRWGDGVLKASTHLVRVGAMSHSGFANYAAGREKQREVSEVTAHQARPAKQGETLDPPTTCGEEGRWEAR